jgi:hypothetical protein
MPNDRLLDMLVTDLRPVRPRCASHDLLALGLLGAIELGLFLLFGAARHDIMTAMAMPSFWWKLGSLGLLAGVAAAIAVRSFHPAASPRRGLRWLPVLIGAILIVGWLIGGAGSGGSPLAMRLTWHDGIACIVAMALLSIPPILAMGLLMRRGAPTDRPGSALAAGIASAAWGAFVFVFSCPHDDPLYVAIWYLAGCVTVSLVAWLILPRIARW